MGLLVKKRIRVSEPPILGAYDVCSKPMTLNGKIAHHRLRKSNLLRVQRSAHVSFTNLLVFLCVYFAHVLKFQTIFEKSEIGSKSLRDFLTQW